MSPSPDDFKNYVHGRLDTVGIPAFNDGRACRIGARLDYIFGRLATGSTPITFPPHWFTVSRMNTSVVFQLTPCNVSIPTYLWRLYPDGLRVADLIHVVESLKNEPQGTQLVLCYVDSIDSAVYLMDAGRTTLAAMADSLETIFKPTAPIQQPDLGKPAEPAPPGDPATFTMDELRAELDGKAPVPFGTAHQFPQGDKTSDERGYCLKQISHDNQCTLMANHEGPCQS